MNDGRTARFAAVLFDFGGTLDADGDPSIEQFRRAYRQAGGQRSDCDFESVFRESDRRLAADAKTRSLGFRDTVTAQSRLLVWLMRHTERLDALQIAATVVEAARSAAERNLLVLQALRTRGILTAIVSNFTGNLDHCVVELGLAPAIDLIVDSAVVGVRKPDPAIFALALQQLHVDARHALMVGDNPFADIRAASALGISTCWLAPLARMAPDGCPSTFRIARLVDLLARLEIAEAAAVAPCTD